MGVRKHRGDVQGPSQREPAFRGQKEEGDSGKEKGKQWPVA